MSRATALAALSGDASAHAFGVTWLPADLREGITQSAGSGSRAEATAATCAAIPVDLAFVSGAEADAAAFVDALHDVDLAALWVVDGVLTRVAQVDGWIETLKMTAAEPVELAFRLDRALHDALSSARDALSSGADAVVIADDLAGPSGPLVAPDYALDSFLPCYTRLATLAREEGLPAVFHSDGDIRVFLPALARSGFSAVHFGGLGGSGFSLAASAARRVGLVSLGGIEARSVSTDPSGKGEALASDESLGSGVIVCDDGGMTAFEQLADFGVAVEAVRRLWRQGS